MKLVITTVLTCATLALGVAACTKKESTETAPPVDTAAAPAAPAAMETAPADPAAQASAVPAAPADGQTH